MHKRVGEYGRKRGGKKSGRHDGVRAAKRSAAQGNSETRDHPRSARGGGVENKMSWSGPAVEKDWHKHRYGCEMDMARWKWIQETEQSRAVSCRCRSGSPAYISSEGTAAPEACLSCQERKREGTEARALRMSSLVQWISRLALGPVRLGSSGLGRDRVGSGRAGLDWILCSRLPDWRRLDSARRERCGTRAQAPDLGDAAAGRPAAENRLDGDEKDQADLPERMRGAGSGRAALRVWWRSAEVCVCCMWWWLEVLETRRSSPGPGRRFEVCSHPPGATQPDSNAVQAGAPQQPQQPNQA